MKDARKGYLVPIRVFRPQWKVQFDDGTALPATSRGIQLGTVAEHNTSSAPKAIQQTRKPFDPEWDILFIDTCVFEYCERVNTAITFDIENGLPDNLNSLQNVAIDASSLSLDRHDVWYKKLRFILRNFPKVSRITVIATIVLDIASPVHLTQPMYHMDIQNISVHDRMRHGILFGEDLLLFPHCTETNRPSDFAIRAWNDIPNHWPTWKKRKENHTAPCMFITAVVYFKKEWISLEGEGGPGGPCILGGQRVDVTGTMIRNEVKKQSMVEADARRSLAIKSMVRKQTSVFSLKRRKPMLSLKNRQSLPTLDSQASTLVGQTGLFGTD